MSASTVAQAKSSVGEPNLGGRPEVIKLDGEDAMNAIAILDDVVKAAQKSQRKAVEQCDDIIRKALRHGADQDVVTCAKRARFDAIEQFNTVIQMAAAAKKSLAASIAKYNGEKSERAA